jgi:hypothetical protein
LDGVINNFPTLNANLDYALDHNDMEEIKEIGAGEFVAMFSIDCK